MSSYDDNGVLGEKFKNYDEKIDDLQKKYDKMNDRITEIDKKTDSLETALSSRLVQIETKFDIYNSMTSDKLDKLEKKMDEIIVMKNANNNPAFDKLEKKMDDIIRNSSNSSQSKEEDSFKQWLQKIGMKILEYSIFVALALGIAKGFKLI